LLEVLGRHIDLGILDNVDRYDLRLGRTERLQSIGGLVQPRLAASDQADPVAAASIDLRDRPSDPGTAAGDHYRLHGHSGSLRQVDNVRQGGKLRLLRPELVQLAVSDSLACPGSCRRSQARPGQVH
jgi:hypothetical protein